MFDSNNGNIGNNNSLTIINEKSGKQFKLSNIVRNTRLAFQLKYEGTTITVVKNIL